MARNTVHRVEFENTTKREKARRDVRAAEGAGDTEDTRVRRAVDRGASFIDILRQSAGFRSNAEAEEYLAHVAKKRDMFLKEAEGLRDISPGLLHADTGSHLRLPARGYLTYGESRSDQFSPIIRRSDRGFWDQMFTLEQKGRIWKHGSEGTEEEVALHPFNTVDQVGGDATTANLIAAVVAPFPRGQTDATSTERRLNAHAGIYEQMRFAEFQRAVAGLKRTVLRHINQRDAETPVAQRADVASQTVREILEKSRKVYENTNGSTADRDDAVFNMLRQDYKDVLPHIGATEESTGFPPHVVAAVRAYATLPARARGDGGLYNQWTSAEEKPQLDQKDLTYFIDALDLVDKAVRPPENRRVNGSQADIIDATAHNARQQASADAEHLVHAAEGGGDAGPEAAVPGTPVSEASAQQGGPRIVVNPKVFTDRRDALCVAFNEAIRLVCEENGFEPVSEPTEKQRKFFADTAYADDELQLRRTILARIATLDTSVKDPTDEQLEETAEMLEMVMEVGAPQNEWEQQAVQRLHDVVLATRKSKPE